MMLADDQQEEQPDGAKVLGENFQLPPVVNVDVSDELLARHITREKKTLLLLPLRVQDGSVCAVIDTGPSRNLISQRVYEALPQQPTLRPPGTMMLVAGNN